MKILGQRTNVSYEKFKTLENFTFEEIENIRKEFDGLQHAEFKMKEAITSLEFRLMNMLRMIETLKDEVKTLKEGMRLEDLHHSTIIVRPRLILQATHIQGHP